MMRLTTVNPTPEPCVLVSSLLNKPKMRSLKLRIHADAVILHEEGRLFSSVIEPMRMRGWAGRP
jgi:hypothetical protein